MDKNYLEILKKKLHELLTYDPESGIFTYRVDYMKHKAGDQAGSDHELGYKRIYLHRRTYQDSLLAWLYMTGEFHKYIKRIDDDYSNCRFKNLQPSSKKVISQHRIKRHSHAEVMNAFDMPSCRGSYIARRLDAQANTIIYKLKYLVSNGYLSLKGYEYTITAKGHKGLMSGSSFPERKTDDLLIIFQRVLTGRLTGATKAGSDEVNRHKLFV